jgi:hypothetical protein
MYINEKNVSTKKTPQKQSSRFSQKNENGGRPQRNCKKKKKGQGEINSVAVNLVISY